MRMIRLKPGHYAGRRLLAGDEFEVRSRRHARLLEKLGRAVEAPEPFEWEPPVVEEPDVEVEEEKPKRTYRRRDLKAEE